MRPSKGQILYIGLSKLDLKKLEIMFNEF